MQPLAYCANLSPAFTPLKSYTAKPDAKWILANLLPQSQNQFLIIDHQHQLQLTDKNDQLVNLIDGKQTIQHLVKFTALTLHPNFAFPQQHGGYTFYTAHIELSQGEANRLRVPLKSQSPAPFDNVVTEWQLKITASGFQLIKDSRRELIRIPLPKIEAGITQLSFHPFIKNWQKHFGLLFITLPAIKEFEQHPLYSGSVLRINPASFGLRAYTVPTDNPFTLDDNVHPEIAATGLGAIKHLHWLKEEVSQFAVNNGKQTSIATLGTDWRTGKRQAGQSVEISNISNMLYFRNSALSNDMRPFLYLMKKGDNWTLTAISLAAMSLPSEIMQLPSEVVKANAKPLLFKGSEGQLLLLDLNAKSLFRLSGLKAAENTNISEVMADTDEASDSGNTFTIVWLLALLAIVGFFWVRKQEKFKASKRLLNKHYARFEVDQNNGQIHLYLRHHEKPSKSLLISDVVKCDASLNDNVLASISAQSPITNAIERTFNHKFKEEKRHKMIGDKVRKVSMTLKSNDKKVDELCLYLREGNQRLTKMRFEQVQSQVLDCLWLLSNKLAPEQTEKRIIDKAPSRPKPKAKNPTTTSVKPAAPVVKSDETNIPSTANIPAKPSHEPQPNMTEEARKEKTDAELIDSLNKLLELKSQGFLTEEEFTNSKAKIISQLSK